jgi:hypothetical protein
MLNETLNLTSEMQMTTTFLELIYPFSKDAHSTVHPSHAME